MSAVPFVRRRWAFLVLVPALLFLAAHRSGSCIPVEPEPTVCSSAADCLEAGDWCSKPVGACAEEGVCEPRPAACPTVWAPVCGCDGVTYGSDCLAAGAGRSVAYAGPCDELPPVSCDDARDCAWAWGSAHGWDTIWCSRPAGACDAPGICRLRPVGCPDVWRPVCCCDGQTYGNVCEAAAAGVNVASEDGGCSSCPAHRPFRDPLRGVCVECLTDADCADHPNGARCDEHVGLCGGSLCAWDEECAPPATTCTNAYDLFRTGFCVPACAPFAPDGGGCEGADWCFPAMRTAGVGICTPPHPAALPAGAACDRLGLDLAPADCAPGLVCWQSESEPAALCRALCDPAAAPGAPGATCPTTEVCRRLRYEVPAGWRDVAFGVCAEP